MLKKLLLGLLGIFLLLQVVQFAIVDRTNQAIVQEVVWDSAETEALARIACYDCHSNEVTWPLYSYIAPISFIVAHHVDDGREYLNFSDWTQTNHTGEFAELIQDDIMPLREYRWLHSEARLTDEEKTALIAGLEATFANDPPIEPEHGSHSHDDHH